MAHPGQVSCKLWVWAATVRLAQTRTPSTIGLTANKYAQAYYSYDSMKSGGLTQSHLRFGDGRSVHWYRQLISSLYTHRPMFPSTTPPRTSRMAVSTCLSSAWSVDELNDACPQRSSVMPAIQRAQFYIIDAGKLAA